MIFPLKIPSEKRQIFLDYFGAKFRANQASFAGNAQYLQDGSFETSTNVPFPIKGDERIHLKWTLRILQDGSLTEIEITSLDPLKDEAIWRESVQSFIHSVLTASVGERRQKYFQRKIFCYLGPPLDGEYWFSGPPKFRFAPFDPSDNEQVWHYERVVCIGVMMKSGVQRD